MRLGDCGSALVCDVESYACFAEECMQLQVMNPLNGILYMHGCSMLLIAAPHSSLSICNDLSTCLVIPAWHEK